MFDSIKKLHIFRRLAALALAFILVVGVVLPASAADSGSCGKGVSWSLSGGHLSISGTGEMTNFTDDNMPPWFDQAETITRVTVGSGVTRIGSLAFYGCTGLTTVSLPGSLNAIGARAFKNCTALGHISFPSGLTTIGEAAFENCSKLSGIRLPSGLKTIGDYAFYRCSSLASITVPAGVQYFGMVVFAYCENLTQATINCSLRSLPDWTFYGCRSLSAVVLPETVETAGEYTFHECNLLEDIHYTGPSEEQLMEDIRKDDNGISSTGGINTGAFDGTGIKSEGSFNEEGTVSTTTTTTVTETENSTTTKEVETESTYQMDGKDVSIEDIAAAGENANVEVTSKKDITITSTVDNSDGWEELADQVSEALRSLEEEDEQLKVEVYLPGSQVLGEDLIKLAGKNASISITTPANDVWQFNGLNLSPRKIADNVYDFSITVTEAEGKTKINGETVYQLTFAENVGFPVTVGVHLGHAYQLATLYQKNGSSFDELHTVIIDANGVAWLNLPEVLKNGKYYVGINVSGKTIKDATIPATLYQEYGLTDETVATLTDAQGNYYEVGERTSSWGITGSEFMTYIGIILGGVVLVVTLLMVTLNKIRKSKEKYRVEKPEDDEDDDDDPIDEEELRVQIMRELLEETQNGGMNDK